MMKTAAYNAVQDAQFAFNTAVLEAAHNTRNISLLVTATQYLKYGGTVDVAGKTFNANNIGDDVVNALFDKVFPSLADKNNDFATKVLMLKSATGPQRTGTMSVFEEDILDDVLSAGYHHNDGSYYQLKNALNDAKTASAKTTETVSQMSGLTKALYVTGGISLLVSAVTMGISIYNYYHPTYDDIPTAMVDLIDTKDGDRYIKYDVVYEAEPQVDGKLIAADLNAFSANRWNALYYTKSYEAGKPLLADEFVVSNTSNVPGEKHMPVHRFGEVVCYNLNKYNFNDDHLVYLSVKQSDNQKAAVADVPEVIGSFFGKGFLVIAGGVGLVAGIGGTIASREVVKTAKSKKDDNLIAEDENTSA
jgi:hypothetical protein